MDNNKKQALIVSDKFKVEGKFEDGSYKLTLWMGEYMSEEIAKVITMSGNLHIVIEEE